MTIQEMLQVAQLGATFLMFGGIVFGMGRMTERLTGVEKGHLKTDEKVDALKEALFGSDGSDGTFVRRAEFRDAQDTSIREREAQDRRLTDLAHDIGALRERVGRE